MLILLKTVKYRALMPDVMAGSGGAGWYKQILENVWGLTIKH